MSSSRTSSISDLLPASEVDLSKVHPDYLASINRPVVDRQAKAKQATVMFELRRRGAVYALMVLLSTLFSDNWAPLAVVVVFFLQTLLAATLFINDSTVRRVSIAAHVAALGVVFQQRWLVSARATRFCSFRISSPIYAKCAGP